MGKGKNFNLFLMDGEVTGRINVHFLIGLDWRIRFLIRI